MPSLVTSVFGGFQSASAAHNAANAISQGYNTAGQTVTNAAQEVNPWITGAATVAGQGVTGAAGMAGTEANSMAAQLAQILSPYISGGSTAMNTLTAGLAPGGTFTQPFTASMMSQYSPAYQFQLAQGQQAAARAAAASGQTGSGGTAKALSRYAQDYANTAFSSAANLYNQQQQNAFNRLATVAGMGQQAGTTAGQAGLQAAEYGGTLGTQAAQYAGTAGINAADLSAQNTLSAANYLANTQIGSAQAQAQGDLGAASAWNNMLNSVGQAGNALLMGGFAPGGGGWNIGNIGTNFGNMWGSGGGYSPATTANIGYPSQVGIPAAPPFNPYAMSYNS